MRSRIDLASLSYMHNIQPTISYNRVVSPCFPTRLHCPWLLVRPCRCSIFGPSFLEFALDDCSSLIGVRNSTVLDLRAHFGVG